VAAGKGGMHPGQGVAFGTANAKIWNSEKKGQFA